MLAKLYTHRFKIFFFSQIFILFGSLFVPSNLFDNVVAPVLFQINILSGVLLVSKKKKILWFLIVLLVATSILTSSKFIFSVDSTILSSFQLFGNLLFYIVVTTQLILQVWKAKIISENEILGLISGYVSLGLIGYLICFSIELHFPGSYEGFREGITLSENIMYFSYITLLTIGYGDVLPVTPLAQNSVILIGMSGQMYLVVITAIVVGKYVNQSQVKE